MSKFLFGKTNWRVIRVALIGVFGFFIIAALIPIQSTCRCGGPEAHAERRLKSNLRSIAQGLVVYAGANNDVFPDPETGLGNLVELGIIEPENLVSPVEDGDGASYFLVSEARMFYATDILVYEDPKHHEQGVLVAFGDASVDYLSFEDFERMLAEQLKAQLVEP